MYFVRIGSLYFKWSIKMYDFAYNVRVMQRTNIIQIGIYAAFP